MHASPLDVVPPDDSGTDTFARYVYQAHVTFVFCLDAALGGEVDAVYTEHVEDVAVRTGERWRFLQVKSRNQDRGPWSLAELAGSSGAIHSLWRAFQAVGSGVNATYECHLEGALKKDDPIRLLATAEGRDSDALRKPLQRHLGGNGEALAEFARRLRVVSLPLRRSIYSDNLALLGKHAPNRSMEKLTGIYVGALDAIRSAMTADHLDGSWPGAVLQPDSDPVRQLVLAKEISRERSRVLFAALRQPPSAGPPFVLPQVDVPTFTDREEPLSRLETLLLREPQRVVRVAAIGGGGGVGKSALIAHFAEKHRTSFQDGVVGRVSTAGRLSPRPASLRGRRASSSRLTTSATRRRSCRTCFAAAARC